MRVVDKFKLLRDSLSLDAPKLHPLASRKSLEFGFQATAGRSRKRENLGSFALAKRCVDVWLNFGKALFRKFQPLPPLKHEAVLFLEISRNHHHALRPVVEQMPNEICQVIDYDDIFGVVHTRSHVWAPLFIPVLFVRWLRSKGYERDSFRWSLDVYLQCYGMYIEFRSWLRTSRPRAIVFSNDHVSWSCSLRQAAKDEGIPTVYVQHACVTENFPPLEFDFALLDGEDAQRKYAQAGESETVVRLVGMPKMDAELNSREVQAKIGTQTGRFGISFNAVDSAEEVSATMQLASVHAGKSSASVSVKTCVVRPHPASKEERRQRIKADAKKLGLEFSDPTKESPFDFLRRLDVIVCGPSSIAIEAAIMNVLPIVVSNDASDDYYGFVATGLATPAKSVSEAILLVGSMTQPISGLRELAKRYCATIETEFEGKSALLAADYIQEIANTGKLSTGGRLAAELSI